MDDILTDLTPEKLALANEANLISWVPTLGKLGEVKADDPPGLYRAVCNFNMALFNSIMETRLTAENVDETIAYIISDAKQRKVPILWWIGPSTQPADLATHLQGQGFTKDDDGLGMGVDLQRLNERLPVPEGLSIRAAREGNELEDWCRTMFVGFEAPPSRIDYAAKSWQKLLEESDAEAVQPFTAWIAGAPLATSLLALGGGVAGIYAVSTIPSARRRGIGAQVTLYALLRAREMGYKAGVLQASEMGEGVYRSLGFEAVCRITSYRYSP